MGTAEEKPQRRCATSWKWFKVVHLANAAYRLGRTLSFDPAKQEVIGDEEANRLLRDADRGYRKPFCIPEDI